MITLDRQTPLYIILAYKIKSVDILESGNVTHHALSNPGCQYWQLAGNTITILSS
jgi:hypothetical protein